ncbi:MAG: RluA family pseudouridine synthase [Lachnospiraceae bacterium]|nr:RluA family pseudouridine synthase [Lachnospiraceae bacterium]
MKCEILFEDEHLLVIRKPAGLATESADLLSPDVVSEMKSYLKATYIGLVHRLDQPVEGILALGKTQKATDALSRQLSSGALKKSYFALAFEERGAVSRQKGESFTLTDYMKKDPVSRKAVFYPGGKEPSREEQKGPKGYKKAVLQCSILERDGEGVLSCRIRIDTGRFHQIRAQMARAGYPLLGDQKYGTEGSLDASEKTGHRTVALCADQLTLLHPVSGREMQFSVTPNI